MTNFNCFRFEGLTELKSQSENQTENVLVREVQGEKFVNTISVEVHQELGSFQVAPKSSPVIFLYITSSSEINQT